MLFLWLYALDRQHYIRYSLCSTMSITIKFYDTDGKKLNHSQSHLDLNQLMNVTYYNDVYNNTYHEQYSCGKFKPVTNLKPFSYYVETINTNSFNFHIIFRGDYSATQMLNIIEFLQTILKFHISCLQTLRDVNLYVPNIRTPLTKLISCSDRIASQYELISVFTDYNLVLH
jgi:hypothetical protein